MSHGHGAHKELKPGLPPETGSRHCPFASIPGRETMIRRAAALFLIASAAVPLAGSRPPTLEAGRRAAVGPVGRAGRADADTGQRRPRQISSSRGNAELLRRPAQP